MSAFGRGKSNDNAERCRAWRQSPDQSCLSAAPKAEQGPNGLVGAFPSSFDKARSFQFLSPLQ
jgi:hypothetical protein